MTTATHTHKSRKKNTQKSSLSILKLLYWGHDLKVKSCTCFADDEASLVEKAEPYFCEHHQQQLLHCLKPSEGHI